MYDIKFFKDGVKYYDATLTHVPRIGEEVTIVDDSLKVINVITIIDGTNHLHIELEERLI